MAASTRVRRRPRRRLSAPLLALLLLATACGQHRGVHERAAALSFRALVPSDPLAGAPGDGYLRGGIARIRVPGKAKRRPAPSVRPGEVYAGTERLEVRIPDAGSGTITYAAWAALLLRRLDAPVCGNNLVAVVAWQVQEGTRAAWNPLATTRGMPGASVANGHGVRHYTSLGQGLEATVLTLQEGWHRFGYGRVVERLRTCAHPLETAEAIRASWWCRDCADGGYTVRLVPAVIDAFNRAVAP